MSDTIGLEIEVNETESQVGDFKADIEGIDAVIHEYVAAIEHPRSFVLYGGVGKIEHFRR